MQLDVIVILAFIILFVCAFLIYNFYRKRYRLLVTTQTSKITTLKKGYYEIKGRVKFLNDKLISPFSRENCVYYHFKVQEQRSSGKSSYWKTIIDDKQFVRFGIQDSSGIAIIELEGATLKFSTDAKGRTGIFRDASEEFTRALAQYNKSWKGWVFNKVLRFKEIQVAFNDELIVLGEVSDFEGYFPVFSKGKFPYLISDKPETTLVRESKLIARVALLFLLVIPLAAAIYFSFRNSLL